MKTTSSLAILLGLALAVSAPAYAKASIQKGQSLCKAAVSAQEPAPKSVRIVDDYTRVNNDEFNFTFKLKNADDSQTKVECSVDRETLATSLKPVA